MPTHDCNYGDTISKMDTKLDKLCSVIVGDLNGNPGLMDRQNKSEDRIGTLEGWRASLTKRVKSRMAWVYALLAGLVIVIGTKVADKVWP